MVFCEAVRSAIIATAWLLVGYGFPNDKYLFLNVMHSLLAERRDFMLKLQVIQTAPLLLSSRYEQIKFLSLCHHAVPSKFGSALD